MNRFLRFTGAALLALSAAAGCELVDDKDRPEIQAPPPVIELNSCGPDDIDPYLIYDGSAGRPYTILVGLRGAEPEDVTITPQGFSIEAGELVPVGEEHPEGWRGIRQYEVTLTGAEGMEPGRRYTLRFEAAGEGGTSAADWTFSLAYMDNPFTDGVCRPQRIEATADDCFDGELVYSLENWITVRASVGFSVEVLEDATEAQLKRFTGSLERFHPILHHYEHRDSVFALVTRRNETAEPKRYRIRVTDAGGVYSYEGDVEVPRSAEPTTEEQMAMELNAMRKLRDALGLADCPDFADDIPINRWTGVNAPDHPTKGGYFVRGVEWRHFDIDGHIPDEIGALVYCTRFVLSSDRIRLHGPIPEGITGMKNLRHFAVEGGLEGRFEDAPLRHIVGQMKQISVGNNNLTGPVPEWLADAPDDCCILFEGNRLEGKVPERVQNHPFWTYVEYPDRGSWGEQCMRQQPGYELWL